MGKACENISGTGLRVLRVFRNSGTQGFQWVWDGASELASLTSSQVMLMLVVLGSHFENHWPDMW